MVKITIFQIICHLMKNILLTLFVWLLFHSSYGQKQSNESLADAIGFIDAWLEAQQAYDNIPGISVGIVKDQQVIWTKGYGYSNVQKNVPATPETVYSICSISKLFTAIAIMQLYENGKLQLDDSVATHLPDFNIRRKFKESGPITIRSLLTHSSGLPRESDFPYWTGPDFKFPTQKQITGKLAMQETLYPASTNFQYSNLGMSILGLIVERISGKPYDMYVEEHILKPLRLNSTHPYLPAAQWGKKMATGYASIKRDGTRDIVPLLDTKGMKPAVGFSSTVEDLARFVTWQFRLIHNGKNEILNGVTLKEMQRVQWVDPDWNIHSGLGFLLYQQNKETLIGNFGTCPGYRTALLIDPKEKLGFIVMINAMISPWKYVNQIRKIILKAQTECQVNSKHPDLKQYTGGYHAQPMHSELKVLSWGRNLAIVDYPSENPLENMALLTHVEDDTFRCIRRDQTLGEEVTFERDDKTGKVTRMWRHSNFLTKIK